MDQDAIAPVELGDCTAACSRYVSTTDSLIGLVVFVGNLLTRTDETVEIARKALIEYPRSDEERARLEASMSEDAPTARKTMQKHYAQTFTRLVLVGVVDNFLAYLAELLKLIFTTRPEALSSGETVKLEEVVRHSSLEDLLTFLVERKVDRLAYQTLRDLASEAERILGLTLFTDEADLARAVDLVATRNVLVHNRGVVNERYLRQLSSTSLEAGDEVRVTGDEALAAQRFLTESVVAIDQHAVAKFGLPIGPAPAPGPALHVT